MVKENSIISLLNNLFYFYFSLKGRILVILVFRQLTTNYTRRGFLSYLKMLGTYGTANRNPKRILIWLDRPFKFPKSKIRRPRFSYLLTKRNFWWSLICRQKYGHASVFYWCPGRNWENLSTKCNFCLCSTIKWRIHCSCCCSQVIDSVMNKCPLWNRFERFQLSDNIHVLQNGNDHRLANFVKWLLDVNEGKLLTIEKDIDYILIPLESCLPTNDLN